MKCLFLLFLVAFLLLLTQHPVSAQNDLVTQTCQKTPYIKLCTSTLRSDPKSKTADIAGLGLIVVNAVKTRTRAAMGSINKLIASNPRLKGPLSKCYEFYNAVLNADVPSAIEAFSKGDPKFAESGMADAADEAAFCEAGFGRGKSPMSSVNKQVHELSLVGAAIARILL